jgi:hypothetical protein
MGKKDDSLFTFAVAWALVLMIATFVLFCYSSGPDLFKKQYWHYVEGYYPQLEGGYGGAPDGEYNILVSFVNRTNRVVGAAYCESSPGDLHGYWSYVDGLNFTVSMYRVCLKNNVIVWALEK